MDHVAIMNTSWHLLPKILHKEKTIESRWYKIKAAPWNRINKGDTIYFKDAGDLVRIRAEVEKVLEFENYTPTELKNILHNYAGKGRINFVNTKKEVFHKMKTRKYCILIFLKNPKKIVPFALDKTGYGNACAWICVENIETIKINIETIKNG